MSLCRGTEMSMMRRAIASSPRTRRWPACLPAEETLSMPCCLPSGRIWAPGALEGRQLPQRQHMQQDRARHGKGRDHDRREAAELGVRPVGDDELQRARGAQDADADGDGEVEEAEDVPGDRR